MSANYVWTLLTVATLRKNAGFSGGWSAVASQRSTNVAAKSNRVGKSERGSEDVEGVGGNPKCHLFFVFLILRRVFGLGVSYSTGLRSRCFFLTFFFFDVGIVGFYNRQGWGES